MASKFVKISELAQETAKKIVQDRESWMHYLDTAARLYKYPFQEQLLIYAQRPDATACASIELWNSKQFNCWVNKGAKGIALIDEDSPRPALKYVYDISDVHKARRIGRYPYIWTMRKEHQPAVIERLEKIYGSTDHDKNFSSRVMELADRIAEDSVGDAMEELAYLTDGSYLEGLDEHSIRVHLRDSLQASVAYTLLRRCGEDVSLYTEDMNFEYLQAFNTLPVLSVLGSYTTELCKPVLMEVYKTIWAFDQQLKKKALAKDDNLDYNALKRKSKRSSEETQINSMVSGEEPQQEERSQEDGTDIPKERRLLHSEYHDGQTGGSDVEQVRQDEEELSERTQEGRVFGAVIERKTDRASADDAEHGGGEDGTDHQPDGESRGRDGGTESIRSVEVDAADEQPAPVSGGDRSAGDYIQLSLFPSVEEQVGNIAAAEAGMKYTMPAAFSVPEEYLDVILRTGGGRDDSRKRIYAQYQLGKTPEEISEFLQSEYKVTGKGFEFDGQPVAVWFDEHGMRLGYGTSAKESTLVIYSWEEVEKRIRSMVERGTYMAADEVTLVEESEHKRIADQIYYFFRDGINDMPDLLKTKGYGYPEFMDKTMMLLASKEGQQKIYEEIRLAKEKLDAGEVRLKWRFVAKPEYLLDQVADQWKEKAEFPVSEKVDVLKESFITQDEIDTLLTGGSGFERSRFRIYEFFQKEHTQKESIDFLKGEYGTGGKTPALPGADHSSEDHDAKGISLRKGSIIEPYTKVLLNWKVVEKRIRELMREDRYLDADGKAAYERYKEEQILEAQRREAEKIERALRVECKESIENVITELYDGMHLPEEAAVRIVGQHGTERVQYVLANTIRLLDHDGRVSADNKEWAKGIVPHTEYWNRDMMVTSHPGIVNVFVDQTRRLIEPVIEEMLSDTEQEAASGESTTEKEQESIVSVSTEDLTPAATNFRITQDMIESVDQRFAAKEKFSGNLEAIKTLKKIEREERQASSAEQKILAGLPFDIIISIEIVSETWQRFLRVYKYR